MPRHVPGGPALHRSPTPGQGKQVILALALVHRRSTAPFFSSHPASMLAHPAVLCTGGRKASIHGTYEAPGSRCLAPAPYRPLRPVSLLGDWRSHSVQTHSRSVHASAQTQQPRHTRHLNGASPLRLEPRAGPNAPPQVCTLRLLSPAWPSERPKGHNRSSVGEPGKRSCMRLSAAAVASRPSALDSALHSKLQPMHPIIIMLHGTAPAPPGPAT